MVGPQDILKNLALEVDENSVEKRGYANEKAQTKPKTAKEEFSKILKGLIRYFLNIL